MNFYDIILAKKLSGGGGGITPTGTINIVNNGSYDVTNYAGASVAVPQPSGSISITENGTVDVTQYASAIVAVSGGGGGSSNIVTGTFTVTKNGGEIDSVSIPYNGSGYPVSGFIYVEGGVGNNTSTGQSTWYNSLKMYAVGMLMFVKSVPNTTPVYANLPSTDSEKVTNWAVYKGSDSSVTNLGSGGNISAGFYKTSDPAGGVTNFCTLYDSTTFKYSVANGTKYTHGFLTGVTYRYYFVYSS